LVISYNFISLNNISLYYWSIIIILKTKKQKNLAEKDGLIEFMVVYTIYGWEPKVQYVEFGR